MIKVYKDQSSDRRTRQILKWLAYYRIDYEVLTKKDLTKEVLAQLLALSDHGFEDLLIPRVRISKSRRWTYDHLLRDCQTTQELIEGLLLHPEFIRQPITFDERRLLVGFNEDELRMFLPRSYRLQHRHYQFSKE